MADNCTIIRMLVEDNIYGSVVTHGFAICNHWHNEMEFIYLDKGKLDIDVDGNMYSVVEGQIMIVSSNAMHAYMKTEPGTVIWVAKVYLKKHTELSGYKRKINGNLQEYSDYKSYG